MLEFVNIKGKEKVRLWYEFESRYVGDYYSKYDFDEFHYDIDIEDAKCTVSSTLLNAIDEPEISLINLMTKALNELDGWEQVCWHKLIESCEDVIMEENKLYAMEYFADKQP